MSSIRFAPLRSERFVLLIQGGDQRRRIFQLLLHDKRGSVFVAFPYLSSSQGILGRYLLPASEGKPIDIKLEEGGKTTSRRVKYTQHFDGEAHFSQDGQVRTTIRKQSSALAEVSGHLFTVHVHGGIDGFQLATSKDSGEVSTKRTALTFSFGDEVPTEFKFVGKWYTCEQLSEMNSNELAPEVIGPQVGLKNRAGEYQNGFLLAPPLGSPCQDHVLVLTCEKLNNFSSATKSALSFIGGFDRKEIVTDPSRNTSFLALLYDEKADFAALQTRLGSIDWRNAN